MTRPVLQSLVASLVLTKLDYGIATLVGLPAQQLNRLQSVLNAAARFVCSAQRFDHIYTAASRLTLAAYSRAD